MNTPTVTIGGRSLTVRPLSLRALRDTVLPKLDQLGSTRGMLSPAQLDDVLDIVHVAVSRAHPEVTRDWIADEVTVADLGQLLAVITEASGLRPVPAGEARSP
jgi:hypothetical protein